MIFLVLEFHSICDENAVTILTRDSKSCIPVCFIKISQITFYGKTN
jgi:hypothetical protein